MMMGGRKDSISFSLFLSLFLALFLSVTHSSGTNTTLESIELQHGSVQFNENHPNHSHGDNAS